MPLPRPRATREQIDAAIRDIRKYHHQGRESLRDLPPRGAYAQRDVEEQAKRVGWNATRLRKSRQFASPDQGYTQSQLNELCRLLREHRPLFGIAHIGIMVTAPWPERTDLQRQCIEENWSKSELEAEIRMRFGSRRQGGRRRKVPDRDHALLQLGEMADSWLRWNRITTEERNGKGKGKIKTLLDALPEKVQDGIRGVNRAMVRLQEAVVSELEVVRSGRRRRR